jgi:hypothetical protein
MPRDPVVCPTTSELLGALGSRLHWQALKSWFCDSLVVNCRKPRVQTLIVSNYLALTNAHDFVLLFLPPCGLHLIAIDGEFPLT